MGKDSLQVALIKYNKKTWCKSGILGIIIGLAAIVPGISGSTAAIIFAHFFFKSVLSTRGTNP